MGSFFGTQHPLRYRRTTLPVGGRGASVKGITTPMEGKGDHYTVEEAARVLERTPGRIRQMLRAGELEGIPPEETEGRGWKIPAHAVHARDRTARVERPERPSESPERLQGLESEVRYLRYELGRSRGVWSLQRRRRALYASSWSTSASVQTKSMREQSSCRPS